MCQLSKNKAAVCLWCSVKDMNISEKIKINSEKKLEEWKTTPLKIAVTGQSGTGRKLKLCNIHILYHLYSHIYL